MHFRASDVKSWIENLAATAQKVIYDAFLSTVNLRVKPDFEIG